MALVMTLTSTITCQPAAATAHGGKVAAASTAKLRVDGSPVIPALVQPLPAGPNGLGAIAGCKTPTSTTPSSKPCLRVVSVLPSSMATKLTVSGIGVLLDSVAGTTDGTIGPAIGSLSGTASQNRLTAI
jgi:hypothetical protein